MDLGLYRMKYPLRRLIGGVLPLVRHVDPNVVSWSVLPVGLATAACYAHADRRPGLLLVGAALIAVRMFLATLDGLMAVRFGKSSAVGELSNRVPPELSDVALLLAVGIGHGGLGLAAVGVGWLTSYAGLVGLTAGRPTQSVGPAGSTDRLPVLMAGSVVGFVAPSGFDLPRAFLWYVVVGGTATVTLRLWRTFRP